MSTPTPTPNFFDQAASLTYDERNKKLAPIGDNLHFLIRMILSELPSRARILCIGVGTGAEILSLAQEHPDWQFVGVDPSQPMLDVCQQRLQKAGIADRCKLIAGYVQDLPPGGDYDAVLSVLVAHFVRKEERADFFHNLCSRLRAGGALVNAEISYDLNTAQSGTMINQWKKVQQLMGATPESLAALPQVLREMLQILSPENTERLIRNAGIPVPMTFFQAMMIHGWFGVKA